MLLGTPVATPVPPTSAMPADPRVVAAVVTTMEELVACVNAGDLQRMVALLTDDYFYRFFGGMTQADVETIATPTPLPPNQRTELVSVEDVRLLDDGRVSAVTRVGDARALTIFAHEDERYLIDYSYALSDPATPAP